MSNRAYDKIAERLLEMKDDAGQWRPCWHRTGLSLPRNAVTNQCYRGVNVLVTWATAEQRGYGRNLWASYMQWQSIGAQVRKGETSTPIVYWGRTESEDDSDDRRRWFARSSNVFNIAQVDGGPEAAPPSSPNPDAPLVHVEAFVQQTDARIRHSPEFMTPCYVPALDLVQMPPFESFHHAEGYYGTLLHELTHWTGNKKRCDRDLCGRFGDERYALEELVAELGAAFLCADLGIEAEPRADHAQYLKGWHEKLQHDVPAFMHAVSQAQAAASYLHGLQQAEAA